MPHPTEGLLRRLVDEPAAVPVPHRRHIADCARCSSVLLSIRADAEAIGSVLTGGGTVDVDAAWQRLATSPIVVAPGAEGTEVQGTRFGRLGGSLFRRPAAAALAVGLVLSGAGAAAANGWLQIFRVEKVAPVSISAADLLALPDLSAYGELAFLTRPDLRRVPNRATAAEETGLPVPTVAELPRGITGQPVIQVGRKVVATFTFSAARTGRAAAQTGQPLPPPPPGLEGSVVRLEAGPGVAQIWESSAGLPALVVAQAGAPRAFSADLPYDVVRDYLLSVPGLPARIAQQLRTFAADGSTLPLPIPEDRATTRASSVNDLPATVVQARDRTFAAVVWVQDGLVNVVAGSVDDDEVLMVARSLR